MNIPLKLLYTIIFACFTSLAVGQQVPVYSQYVMNGFLINPSLAGSDGYSSLNLTVRDQWLGLKEGPKTYALAFQSTILRNSYIAKSNFIRRKVSKPTKQSRVGVGAYLFNDNNGIIRRTGLQAVYAYHIPTGKNIDGTQNDFALGLSMVNYQFAVNTDALKYDYSDDPYLNTYDKSVMITDFNFGANYTTSKYYIGFAMTNLLRGSLMYANNSDNKRGELGHFFLTGGLNIPIDKRWSIKPSAFIKTSDMLLKSTQIDLTTRVFYLENYWAGLSYRTNDAIIALFGLRYDKYYFAYAFDLNLTDMRDKSIGSMELTFAVKFGESSRRYRWLNSF